ncbi:hypothetical protein BDV96DRAFT_151171 [Lophiotrema nucula]|uniref:Uncharacterized protein n=1 Tax=Lophiotrema nucula TaxID=690887 RepID=A0A6A5Z100_9PLEO|nr:hypothetical protein BDV96DRAFT_151171 [Lophiotrema nucula]
MRLNSKFLQVLLRKVLKMGVRDQHFSSAAGLTLVRPFKPVLQHIHTFGDSVNVFHKGLLMHMNHTCTPNVEADSKAQSSQSATTALDHDSWRSFLMEQGVYCCSECIQSIKEECPSYDHVRELAELLVKAIDERIKQPSEGLRSKTRRTVLFRDLWYLFQTDDIIVDLTNETKSDNRMRKAYRVLGTHGGREYHSHTTSEYPAPNLDYLGSDPSDVMEPFCIDAYLLDFNGSHLVPIPHRLQITPYSFERDITDLELSPLEYATMETRKDLLHRGQRFVELSFLGSGLFRRFAGTTLCTEESFNERLIVDSSTYFEDHSQSSGKTEGQGTLSLNWIDQYPTYAHRLRSTERRLRMKRDEVNDNDYILCQCRCYAFRLRNLKWVQVHIWDLSNITTTEAALDRLVLPKSQKELLISRINDHQQVRTSPATVDWRNLRIVAKSPEGLMILLHGPPGTGKTATVNSVAERFGLPVYTLSCSSLGTTTEEMETRLSKHLRLAHKWDCITLLEDASLFIGRDGGYNPSFGTTVPVFMRTLEMHHGIVFLELNQSLLVDKSVRSRMHISLYYPPIDNDKKFKKIWMTFLQSMEQELNNYHVGIRVEKEDIMEYLVQAKKTYNGHHIRQAIQTITIRAKQRAKEASRKGHSPEDASDQWSSTGNSGKAKTSVIVDSVDFMRVFETILESEDKLKYLSFDEDTATEIYKRARTGEMLGLPTSIA